MLEKIREMLYRTEIMENPVVQKKFESICLIKEPVVEKYKSDGIVHFQGEQCRYIDIIIEGELQISNIDENGKNLIIANFGPGDIVGASLIFSVNNFYPMTIQAKNDSIIVKISKETVIELCETDTDFMVKFMRILSDRAAFLSYKITDISLKSIRERVMEYIDRETNIQKSNKIRLTMSKKELSEKMGIQRTSLSREMNKMRKDGLIEYNSKYIKKL